VKTFRKMLGFGAKFGTELDIHAAARLTVKQCA